MLRNNIEPKVGMRVRRFQQGQRGTMKVGDSDTIIALGERCKNFTYLKFKTHKNTDRSSEGYTFASDNYELVPSTHHFSIT